MSARQSAAVSFRRDSFPARLVRAGASRILGRNAPLGEQRLCVPLGGAKTKKNNTSAGVVWWCMKPLLAPATNNNPGRTHEDCQAPLSAAHRCRAVWACGACGQLSRSRPQRRERPRFEFSTGRKSGRGEARGGGGRSQGGVREKREVANSPIGRHLPAVENVRGICSRSHRMRLPTWAPSFPSPLRPLNPLQPNKKPADGGGFCSAANDFHAKLRLLQPARANR